MLVFEQAHHEATGVYCLSTPDGQNAFTFEEALDAKTFVDHYFRNPVAAMFAYELREGNPDDARNT